MSDPKGRRTMVGGPWVGESRGESGGKTPICTICPTFCGGISGNCDMLLVTLSQKFNLSQKPLDFDTLQKFQKVNSTNYAIDLGKIPILLAAQNKGLKHASVPKCKAKRQGGQGEQVERQGGGQENAGGYRTSWHTEPNQNSLSLTGNPRK